MQPQPLLSPFPAYCPFDQETLIPADRIGPNVGDPYQSHQIPLSMRYEHRAFWLALSDVLKCAEATAAIALAAYFAARVSNRWISYSARAEHYTWRKILDRNRDRAAPTGDPDYVQREPSQLYTWRLVMQGIEHLKALELIVDWRQKPGVEGWRSCFRPTQALLDIVAGVIAKTGVPKAARPAPASVIQLRDKDGNPLAFRETTETRKWRRIAEGLNEWLREADVSTGSACLVRIFNLDLSRGGRFYATGGAWQVLRKAERHRILINGQPVCELDYATIHPSMAYAMFGLRPPQDSYDIGGDWDRKLVKAAMMTALNAKSFQDAMLSVSANRKIGAVPRSSEARKRAVSLLNRIRQVHWEIEGLFFSDAGATFMLRDSEMAEFVLTSLMKKGVACLPIHDSFLVQRSQRDVLRDAMMEAADRAGMPWIGIEEPV
ncbi:hypothetical protein [Aureimonas sp. SK2]|uniref:hypothetical protein n=1 Tax=Aureimonas sp. SK2 TaxID=3015992 RepID=UPI0024438D80|nr:hypothetical protein [Aureimonas sp. SK2]